MPRVAVAVEQNWNRVPGGTAISTNRLIDALLDSARVDLLGVAGRHRDPPVLALPERLPIRYLPIPGRVAVQSWNLTARPRIDRWLDGADIVHGPAYVMPATRLPAVATVHDLAFRRRPDWFTKHGVRFFERFLDRLVRSATDVIVPSAETARDCVDAGIDEERIHLIPWGVDPVRVEPDAIEAARREHGLNADCVLFVGTLEPRKNLDGLARAMQRLPEYQLVVAGPRGWGDVAAPPGARMLGPVPADRLPALMAAARVLVYPSHWEGFGLPVLEAMAVGTPVVVTEGTAPAVVAGDGGLAVDTGAPDVLADAIASIVGDDSAHGELSAFAAERAQVFSWSAAAAATADVYERVAAR